MCGLVLIAGGMYAGGFSGCLKQRMKQSLDVATFVEEFKDILVAPLNAHFVLLLPAR
jgi:fructose-specific phosphotransferase system IIC component